MPSHLCSDAMNTHVDRRAQFTSLHVFRGLVPSQVRRGSARPASWELREFLNHLQSGDAEGLPHSHSGRPEGNVIEPVARDFPLCICRCRTGWNCPEREARSPSRSPAERAGCLRVADGPGHSQGRPEGSGAPHSRCLSLLPWQPLWEHVLTVRWMGSRMGDN